MLFVLGVLFMIVGVAASIALHEMGHMVPAKKFGVRVPQYMIGFGPTLWSKKRGETEYGVKGIPLGGYVRMIGMYPPKAGDPDGSVRASSTGRFSQLADEVREQTFEELQARIQATADYLASLTPEQVDGGATREITLKFGKLGTRLEGVDYLLQFGLPNFYFHVVTAYDILRHHGVPVGKLDYLGPIGTPITE